MCQPPSQALFAIVLLHYQSILCSQDPPLRAAFGIVYRWLDERVDGSSCCQATWQTLVRERESCASRYHGYDGANTKSTPDASVLNLSPDEKRAFAYLFQQADTDQLGVVTGENAVGFFERTKVSPDVLGEIWQIADTENRGFLSKPGFCMVLRLIGHYQAGTPPSKELAFKQGPVPRFDGLQIPAAASSSSSHTGGGVGGAPPAGNAGFAPAALQPQLSGSTPIRVPPLDPAKVQQYSGLFERSGAQNGLLDGGTAKAIFERAGLSNETLGRIWMLADRQQRGALDQTEFIVAMHLLTSMKTRSMSALPNALPQGLYDAAARRGVPAPQRQGSGQQPILRQVTGQSAAPMRAQSPLARPPAGFGTPPPVSAQTTGVPWLVTPADKAKFDQFFNTVDTQGRGIITGEQAVSFFSDSRLPEDTLAQIWDLADINSEGQLNKDEFAVAMYLIRQQRGPGAAPLPAFLPPPLIPPSMRAQQQQTQSTAPAFDNAAQKRAMPKSAADDLFGLDEPAQTQAPTLQPQGTGASATRDPFAGGSPASPSSPARFQPQAQQASSMFKPFMPTSAFGASLAQQNTGGSFASNQGAPARAPVAPTTNDDLLGDNDTTAAEASKITNETTELANMSNQIGNLRGQMEQTQAKKNVTQAEVNQTSAQKRDLELRLQQFRTQYEQEVRTVKELEQQLAASRDSTKKLGQELAMLEGSYQDLQTQHQTVSQQLQADQQENANLKQRISQINSEVARLKPEIEKMRLDARQQKGLVSINKKQLATNEGEHEKLQSEKTELERLASERGEQARSQPAESAASPPPSNLASPAASVLSSTNPFFRKPSNEGGEQRAISPQQTGNAPNPSAFDALFGPPGAFAPAGQAGSRTGTPPATSFIARSLPVAAGAAAGAAAIGGTAAAAGMSDSVQSVSSVGQHTPSATPPLSEKAKESPSVAEPPPPPEDGQFTASQLPVIEPDDKGNETDNSSTRVAPPASRAGGTDTPREGLAAPVASALHVPGSFADDPKPETAGKEGLPGAFPVADDTPGASRTETPEVNANNDFDSAFAGFGDSNKSNESEHDDPFGSSSKAAPANAGGFSSEFPPIRSLEHDDDDSDSSDNVSDRGFDNGFTAAPPSQAQKGPASDAAVAGPVAALAASHTQPETSSTPLPAADSVRSPPAYEDSNKPTHGGTGERSGSNQFPPEFGGLLPAREDPTSPPPPDGPSPAVATATEINTTQSPVQTPSVTSSGNNAFNVGPSSSAPSKNAFDDFDDFDGLADAKEADRSGGDIDFGYGEPSNEFNPTFDSPAASTTNTMASSQQTPIASNRSLHQADGSGSNGFAPSQSAFGSSTSGGTSSIQQSPQNGQHDWDAIFSGLDSSKNIDTSLNSDPWGDSISAAPSSFPSSATAGAPSHRSAGQGLKNVPERGGALTPGTEHDDPILKRLTGMGYPRGQALDALEKFDYDINRVS